LLAVGVATLYTSWPDSAAAEGALAVGTTGNVARDGYSIGIGSNYATKEEAKNGALDHCRNKGGGGELTKKRCEIVNTFHHQCVAEAEDPKGGTPGAGCRTRRRVRKKDGAHQLSRHGRARPSQFLQGCAFGVRHKAVN
jgi:hypothetical protein